MDQLTARNIVEDHAHLLRDDSGVSIILLTTLNCNFKCRHCLYACEPKYAQKNGLENILMPFDVVRAILNGAERLMDLGIHVSNIDIVGGEPTLNMSHFERVWQIVSEFCDKHSIHLHMTTNGWWLKDPAMTVRFLKIVEPYASTEDFGMGVVRISNDKYHDPYRPAKLQDGKLVHYLNMLKEGYADDFATVVEAHCVDCGEWFEPEELDSNNHDECPKCQDGYLEFEYDNPLWGLLASADDWLYTQDWKRNSSPDLLTPTGRCHFGNNTRCYESGNILSFNPDGVLQDICCRGSDFRIGNYQNEFLALLSAASHYLTTVKPNCLVCLGDAQEFIEENNNLLEVFEEAIIWLENEGRFEKEMCHV